MISLERLFGADRAHAMRTAGLHKLAAARLRKEGHHIEGDLSLRSAVQALGTNLYIKNAEYNNIVNGMLSLRELTKGR